MSMIFKSKNSIGVDIADHSVEVVETSNGKIIGKARRELAFGIVEHGRIKKEQTLLEIVLSAFKDAKIKIDSGKNLFFGLPECQTFIHIFETDEKEDFESIVRSELCGVVPVESGSMTFGYTTHKLKSEKIRVVAMAAERAVITEWRKFWNEVGFSNATMTSETLAYYVGLGVDVKLLPVAVIDSGANATMMSAYDAYGACFASSLEFAGDWATQKAAEASGMPLAEAESEKCANGLNSKNDKLKGALVRVTDEMITGIKNFLNYCTDACATTIPNLIMIGGTSQMPGLVDYIKAQTGLNVSIGTSLYLSKSNGVLAFIEASGLAFYHSQSQFPVFDHDLEEIKPKSRKAEMIAEMSESKTAQGTEEDVIVKDEVVPKKTRKQLVLLLIIFIIGAGMLSIALLYRITQDKKHQTEIAFNTRQFAFAKTLYLDVPVAISQSEQTIDRAVGRVIENKIQIIGDKNEAIQTSRSAVQKQLSQGEILWKEPLDVSETKTEGTISENVPVDYLIHWLVYNEKSVNSIFSSMAEERMEKTGVFFSISNIEKISVKSTDNQNIFIINGRVIVATERKVD